MPIHPKKGLLYCLILSTVSLLGIVHPSVSNAGGKTSYIGCFNGLYRSDGCGVVKTSASLSAKTCIALVQKSPRWRYALLKKRISRYGKPTCMGCKSVRRNNAQRMPDSKCRQRDVKETLFAVYDLKGLTKTVPVPSPHRQCDRPTHFCRQGGYRFVDCNGDGIKDHVCRNGNNRGTVLSGSGGCRVVGRAPTASCVRVFKQTKTGYIGCYDKLSRRRNCSLFRKFNGNALACAYGINRLKRGHRYAIYWYSRQKGICMGCSKGVSFYNPRRDSQCKLTNLAERYTVYDLKGVKAPAITSGKCKRPRNWCAHAGDQYYFHVDCNGDGHKDHVCLHGNSRGVFLSGYCNDASNRWPNAPKSACPAVFNQRRSKRPQCKRPKNWCAHTGHNYYHSPDCDGDGVRDHVCWHGNSLGLLLSKNCNSQTTKWPNAKKSSCPALKRFCKRPKNWCAHSGGKHYQLKDCNGDGIKDHVCQHRGSRGVLLSGNCNNQATQWPKAPKSSCPEVFGR